MAAGDVTVFNEFLEDIGEGFHDFETDTVKLALISSGITPLVNTESPRWDVSSSQDYRTYQVSTGGAYPDGGFTVPVTFRRTTGVVTLNDDNGDIELDPDPLGFNNARWGILYNASAANKNAIAFVDFGDVGLDETAGAVRIYWNMSGIFTIETI